MIWSNMLLDEKLHTPEDHFHLLLCVQWYSSLPKRIRQKSSSMKKKKKRNLSRNLVQKQINGWCCFAVFPYQRTLHGIWLLSVLIWKHVYKCHKNGYRRLTSACTNACTISGLWSTSVNMTEYLETLYRRNYPTQTCRLCGLFYTAIMEREKPCCGQCCQVS